MTFFLRLGLLWLLLLVQALPSASAEKMRDLYKASWPVADQTLEARNRALANSFAQVLIRASGSSDVLNSLSVKSSVQNAAEYMRQYSYRQLSLEEQDIYKQPLLLIASFDSQAVIRLLKSAGKPIWSENRPTGTFWIGWEQAGERSLVADGQNEVSIALKRAAGLRGLPVTIPLMDLEDEAAVTISDVWGRLPQAVKKASNRYAAEYTASGQLTSSASGGQWRGSWLVQLGSDNLRFRTSGNSVSQAVEALVNRIADHLSAKLAVVLSAQPQTIYLQIDNVTDLKSYATSRNYLQNLSMVKQANAIELGQDKVLFELTILSDAHYLIEALKVGGNFLPTSVDSAYSGQPAVDTVSGQQGYLENNPRQDTYYYRWVN